MPSTARERNTLSIQSARVFGNQPPRGMFHTLEIWWGSLPPRGKNPHERIVDSTWTRYIKLKPFPGKSTCFLARPRKMLCLGDGHCFFRRAALQTGLDGRPERSFYSMFLTDVVLLVPARSWKQQLLIVCHVFFLPRQGLNQGLVVVEPVGYSRWSSKNPKVIQDSERTMFEAGLRPKSTLLSSSS